MKLNWKELGEKIQKALADPFTLEVKTMTGRVESNIKDGRLLWQDIVAATTVTDDSKVKLAAATIVRLDGDIDTFISNDPALADSMASLVAAHAAAVEKGAAIRLKAAELAANLARIIPV